MVRITNNNEIRPLNRGPSWTDCVQSETESDDDDSTIGSTANHIFDDALRTQQDNRQSREIIDASEEEEEDISTCVDDMIKRAPVFSQLYKHQSPCCIKAETALKTNLSLVNKCGGLAGILSAGSNITQWGPTRCEWLCDAWKHRKELDCGAQAAILQMMIECSDECRANQVSVHRIGVILQSSKYEASCWNHLFSQTERDSYKTWIHPTGQVVYHECIGIHSPSTGLQVFDPANQFWFIPSSQATDSGAVFAWFVQSNENDTTDQFQFHDYSIPTNRWFTTMPSINSSLITSVAIKENDELIFEPLVLEPHQQRQLNVYISGVANNNDNPSPGLGVARSLRLGFNSNSSISLQLIAVDFSLESAGLGDSVFDHRIIFPSWEHCTAEQHARAVAQLVHPSSSSDVCSLYISCLDVETTLLARELPHYFHKNPELKDRILLPLISALDQTRKPHIHAGSRLGFKISDFLEVPEQRNDDPTVQSWCISKGFPIIVKGQSYDAFVASSWPEVRRSLGTLQKLWGSSSTFVQKSVVGTEGSLVFSAYHGQLLAAALMHKCMVTSSRKVWSSQLSPVPTDLLENLKNIVQELNWTGGSEIEFIETVDGTRYLIDWNPRFPAWIHGATVAVNVNLPLALVTAAAFKAFDMTILDLNTNENLPLNQIITPLRNDIFMRTVIEQRHTGVQPLILAGPDDSSVLRVGVAVTSKGSGTSRPHPSRNTSAAKQLKPQKSLQATTTTKMSSDQTSTMNLLSIEDVEQILDANGQNTPFLLFNHQLMGSTIKTMEQTIDIVLKKLDHPTVKNCSVNLALSVKTNPSIDILHTGRDHGLLAEGISLLEVRAALNAGFPSEDIILNGPGKWYDRQNNDQTAPLTLLAVIADSAQELEQISNHIATGRPLNPLKNGHLSIVGANYIGVRLAVPGTASRFGVDIGNPEVIERVVNALRCLPASQKTVFHFHYASSNLGLPAWTAAVKAVLLAASTIDRMAGRSCSMLDFGGGWAAHTFNESTAVTPLTEIFADAMQRFPNLERIVFEPGKSLVQSAGVMISRVLAIREPSVQLRESQKDDDCEEQKRSIILDTSIAELPDINSHHHPFAWLSQDDKNTTRWTSLISSNGSDTIYGRICMEHDVLARSIQLPKDLKVGDFIAIASVGAYDASMAYAFGDGSQPVLQLHPLKTSD